MSSIKTQTKIRNLKEELSSLYGIKTGDKGSVCYIVGFHGGKYSLTAIKYTDNGLHDTCFYCSFANEIQIIKFLEFMLSEKKANTGKNHD